MRDASRALNAHLAPLHLYRAHRGAPMCAMFLTLRGIRDASRSGALHCCREKLNERNGKTRATKIDRFGAANMPLARQKRGKLSNAAATEADDAARREIWLARVIFIEALRSLIICSKSTLAERQNQCPKWVAGREAINQHMLRRQRRSRRRPVKWYGRRGVNACVISVNKRKKWAKYSLLQNRRK